MFKMLVVLLVLSGCSTINKLECRKANWKQVGLDDGNKGLPSMLDEYERSCLKNKIIPDGDEYREGHKIGVAQYCTEENGYILGEIGKQCCDKLNILFNHHSLWDFGRKIVRQMSD